jgi:hypothetical protein
MATGARGKHLVAPSGGVGIGVVPALVPGAGMPLVLQDEGPKLVIGERRTGLVGQGSRETKISISSFLSAPKPSLRGR